MRYEYALNIEGLKVGSVYTLNKEYALNNGVHLTTSVYGRRTCLFCIIFIRRFQFLSLTAIANSIHSHTNITAPLCVDYLQIKRYLPVLIARLRLARIATSTSHSIEGVSTAAPKLWARRLNAFGPPLHPKQNSCFIMNVI